MTYIRNDQCGNLCLVSGTLVYYVKYQVTGLDVSGFVYLHDCELKVNDANKYRQCYYKGSNQKVMHNNVAEYFTQMSTPMAAEASQFRRASSTF